MRTAIILFLGMTLGIVTGVSSPYVTVARENHANPYYEAFMRPSIVSVGKVTKVEDGYITVFFDDHSTRLIVSPYTKVTKSAPIRTFFNGTRIAPILVPVEDVLGKVILLKYTEEDNRVIAIEITELEQKK